MKKKLLVLAGAVALGGAGLVMAGSSVHPADARRSASPPAPAAAAFPMYRHPADKNAAATAINAGKTIDIQG